MNYAYLIDTTRQFQDLIEQSPLIENSYWSQFILGPSYAFTCNNTRDQTKRFKVYYRVDIETIGNLLEDVYRLAGEKGKDKHFLGVPFCQYIRLYSDFRAYYQVGMYRTSQLFFRNVLGLGTAYGKSISVPYTRQFFKGGSNSLRPITARVVGPGRYLEFDESAYNQVGDIKIENKLEFRFKIFYIYYGAFCSDMGISGFCMRIPSVRVQGSDSISFKRIVPTPHELGLRFDLGFLVIRADYGANLYLPFFPEDFRWIWQNKGAFNGLIFGIGYPF